MATIRYSKEQLLRWQKARELGDSVAAVLPPELLSAATRYRNVDRRERRRNPLEGLDAKTVSFGINERMYDDGGEDDFEEEDACDDSDEEVSLQPLAFLVTGEPDFESGPPQDGFEYLRRVMWETAQCPKVKIAKIGKEKLIAEQTKYMPEIPPIPVCLPNLLPAKEWVQSFLKDFSCLRAVITSSCAPYDGVVQDLPAIRNKSVWKYLCFGRRTCNDAAATAAADEPEETNPDCASTDISCKEEAICDVTSRSPYLNVVLRLDEMSRAILFRYHVLWLNEQDELAYDRAMWLFALAAAVGCPLDDQTSAAFRDLLRKCAELRVRKVAIDEELCMINILTTIAGEFFGQAEELV